MYLVIKHDGQREVGVNADGTTSYPLDQAELFITAKQADAVAKQHGGAAFSEERIFGEEPDEDA